MLAPSGALLPLARRAGPLGGGAFPFMGLRMATSVWGHPVDTVFYTNDKDRHPKRVTMSFGELADLLTRHERTPCAPCPGRSCTYKHGMAWSPGIPAEGCTRASESVNRITAAVFDLDHLTLAELEAMCEALEGLSVVIHSTHNHRPPAQYNLRAVIQLARPLHPKEWVPLRNEVVRRYGLRPDPKAKDPSRLYFLPSAPEGAEVLTIAEEGRLLDVDAVLQDARVGAVNRLFDVPPQSVPAPISASAPAVPKPADQVDMAGLRKLLSGYRPSEDDDHSKRDLIRRLREGVPLADEGDRDNSVHRVSCILACLLPADTPVEAAMELMRPSVVSLPGPEGGDYWLAKARYSYERAFAERLKRDAAGAQLKAGVLAYYGRDPDGTPKGSPSGGASPGTESPSSAAPSVPAPTASQPASVAAEDPSAWRHKLTVVLDKSGNISTAQVGRNAWVVLEHHPAWKGVIRFNEISKQVDLLGGPLGGVSTAPSVLPAAINNWIQEDEDLGLRLKEYDIKSQINLVARSHPYDPLKEQLLNLTWDGEPRSDGFLERYFGAQVAHSTRGNRAAYVRSVSSKWLISAVARALQPGCKVDTVLVLEGLQGLKKSAAFRILGGEHFAGSQLNIADKDSRLLAAQYWIIELAEMRALVRTDLEAQKAFLSEQVDVFRPPYAPAIEKFPRRCVFVCTTNEGRYFGDLTGNRRFWPVTCTDIDLDALERDRDQLWAEAVVRFQAGERWWFTPEETAAAEAETDDRLRVPAYVEPIWNWWTRRPSESRPEHVKTLDVAVEALEVELSRYDERLQDRVERAMRYLGFEETQVQEGVQTFWVWSANEQLREAPKSMSRRTYLALVANAKVPKDGEG